MHSLTFHQLAQMADRFSHEVPTNPPTIDQAHQAMQDHLNCRASLCPHKEAARQVLIEAGHITPDSDRAC